MRSALDLLEGGRGSAVRMADIAKQAGVSRQALYLHFSTRADLLIEVTHFLDKKLGIDSRLAASRAAKTGMERLDAFVETWANYIPEIYSVARALMVMGDTDKEAAVAWRHRMQDMREGCAAAIEALDRDAVLAPDHTVAQATDLLWSLLSVRNWEHLTIDRRWSQSQYVSKVKQLARHNFVAACK